MGNIIKYTVPDYMQNEVKENENCYMLMHRFLILEEEIEDKQRKKKSDINKFKPYFFSNTNPASCSIIRKSIKQINLDSKIDSAAQAMTASGIYELECFHMKQTWNMAVGLGTTSVSEASMTLHHIYGIPYIPGQALKGIVRSYIICEFFENDENSAARNDLFALMFGRGELTDKNGKTYDSKQGALIFFDAVPAYSKNINCKMDIINNHHQEYYKNNNLKYLNDSENPNLVKLPVISGAEFIFRIAVKKKNNIDGKELKLSFEKKAEEDKTLLDSAVEYTKSALKLHGIGAKTAVGYGMFKEENNRR